ncbi:MAG: DUF433 domain-containing protein [Chloroflexota bacterium]|nr:DUF433 domain-containing protein [Chloroflexota bacterium]MDE2894285.1 DUF433 domain-containing protein [Chloroflexota bacterium]
MCWRDRIERKPGVLTGKPVIKDTRISVEFVLECLGNGWTMEELVEGYPGVSREDFLACLLFASELIHEEHAVGKLVG